MLLIGHVIMISIIMNALHFIGMTKLTSINLRKVKVGVSRADPEEIFEGDLLEGMEGGVPEESSEITKAGVIDSRISIDLPRFGFACVHAIVSEGDNVFRLPLFYTVA